MFETKLTNVESLCIIVILDMYFETCQHIITCIQHYNEGQAFIAKLVLIDLSTFLFGYIYL